MSDKTPGSQDVGKLEEDPGGQKVQQGSQDVAHESGDVYDPRGTIIL